MDRGSPKGLLMQGAPVLRASIACPKFKRDGNFNDQIGTTDPVEVWKHICQTKMIWQSTMHQDGQLATECHKAVLLQTADSPTVAGHKECHHSVPGQFGLLGLFGPEACHVQ